MRHLEIIPFVFSLTTFACGGPAADSPSSVEFEAPTVLTCSDGSSANIIATGDFNGDGLPDLVGCVSNQAEPSFSAFLNVGGGVYGNAIETTGVAVEFLEVHDIDGDGKDDLAIETGSLSLVAISQGTGKFIQQTQPNYPWGCDVDRVSFDGYADSLCYNPSSSTLTVSHMVADGSTQKAFDVTVPSLPYAYDIDNDGNVDLVFNVGSSIGVMLGLGGSSFAPAQIIVTLDNSIGWLTFDDINADGCVDMIVQCGDDDDGNFILLENQAGNGFKALTQIPAVDDITFKFEDVTGDHITDIVATEDAQMVIMIGKGDGTFDSTGLLVTGPWTSAAGFMFKDLNGDSKPDLVVAGSPLSVLLRQ